jgi:hypothetical protein
MFALKIPGLNRLGTSLSCVALFVVVFSVLAAAQSSDKEKDKDKDEDRETKKEAPAAKGNFVSVEGKVRCEKSAPAYLMEVPDRPGHGLILQKRKCTWTEPLIFKGTKTTSGQATAFIEKMEGTLHVHGYEVDNLDNGEKLTWQSMGQVMGEKGPAAVKGRWSLMRGTGKFKGAKGGGSYEGKLDADDVLTLNFEGVYDPTAMGEEKMSEEKK